MTTAVLFVRSRGGVWLGLWVLFSVAAVLWVPHEPVEATMALSGYIVLGPIIAAFPGALAPLVLRSPGALEPRSARVAAARAAWWVFVLAVSVGSAWVPLLWHPDGLALAVRNSALMMGAQTLLCLAVPRLYSGALSVVVLGGTAIYGVREDFTSFAWSVLTLGTSEPWPWVLAALLALTGLAAYAWRDLVPD